MKRTFIFLLALMCASVVFSQQDTLAKWTFPTGNMSDTLPDLASDLNLNKYIFTEGGTSAITMKNGATTKAAQTTDWDNGAIIKSWQVEINTTGFENIVVSSKQTAGGSNPGPRDFNFQYRISTSGIWTDISGGIITVANDWTSGVIDNIQLAVDCNDQTSVFLRWLMVSNYDINGNIVLSTGTAKIDDIIIIGETVSGVADITEGIINIDVYPNPCVDNLYIESKNEIKKIEIYNIYGSKVYDVEKNTNTYSVNTNMFENDIYLLYIHFSDNRKSITKTIVVN